MARPANITDAEYIAKLELENEAMSSAYHTLSNECAVMLSDKDKAHLEKCKKCRGSVAI